MGQMGIGAMIHMLGGGSEHSASEYYGRTICGAEIVDNRLRLTLDGGQKIEIWDNGQSCCESRYMTCDDDLNSLCGHKIVRIEAKDGPNQSADDDEHETCFVEVGTDKGFVTLTNHNEHNGYYGGFSLTITEVANPQ
jgi:hypothetical protein